MVSSEGENGSCKIRAFAQFCAVLSLLYICLLPRVTPAFICLRNVVLPEGTGVGKGSAAGSLLYGTFWTVWERSTLLSRAVKRLLMLLLKAARKVNTLTFRNVCRVHAVLVILAQEQSNNLVT